MTDIRHDTRNSYNNPITLSFFILLSVFAAVFYVGLLFNSQYRGALLPYSMVLIAELYIVVQTLMVSWTILSGNQDPRNSKFFETQHALFSKNGDRFIRPRFLNISERSLLLLFLKRKSVEVDIVITVYGEELEVIEETARAAKNIIGKHRTTILDDGCSDDVARLARAIGVGYIRRESGEGAKAGNINNALKQLNNDFVAIFDADHVPKPTFLYETLPHFHDEKVAFVQTPQFYKNKNNEISRGASYAQDLFYKYICPGKNKFNSAFCVGTNVIFKRSALDEIGGIYQGSKSEDIWTSFLLHERGWKSVFTPTVLAEGEAPDSIKAYVKQQQRWATGGMEIFFHRNPLFRKGLNFNQKLQYFWTASFYLHGLATALLFFLPGMYIIFGLSPINGNLEFLQWFTLYGSFYGLQILIASYCMKGFKKETLMLSTVSFPVYLKAFMNGLLMRDEEWHVTGSTEKDSPFNYIVPQLVLFVFLMFVNVLGVTRFYNSSEVSVALTWNLINTFVFLYFFKIAYKELRPVKNIRSQG